MLEISPSPVACGATTKFTYLGLSLVGITLGSIILGRPPTGFKFGIGLRTKMKRQIVVNFVVCLLYLFCAIYLNLGYFQILPFWHEIKEQITRLKTMQ